MRDVVFKIIMGFDRDRVEKEITMYLQLGYKLNGGLQVIVREKDTNSVKYIQSVFLVEEGDK